MELITIIIVLLSLLIAVEHIYITVLEMFMIPSKRAVEVFDLSNEFMEKEEVKTMFKNQGLYNLFLALGIIVALIASNLVMLLFLLGCVAVAGVYGGLTVNRKIFLVQGLMPIVAIVLIIFNL